MFTKIIVGLTGGIASGKSKIAATFKAHGILNVDADIVARQVVEPGTYGHYQIVLVFGKDYCNDDNTINRIKLGNFVFSNNKALEKLNHIIGPLIQIESKKQIQKLQDDGHSIVVYNAALICEMGNADKYRPLIVASCSQDIQKNRLMKRNGLTEVEAMSRINAQMPDAAKIKLADYVIDTSKDIDNSIKQTEMIIHHLKALNNLCYVTS